MAVKHIAFTMYAVKDMARAQRFYEGSLGLKRTKNFDDVWIEYHLGNGCFAITTMTKIKPSAAAGGSIAFEVDDVDALVAKLKRNKTKVKLAPFSTPVCRMAVVLDPDGNAVGIHAKLQLGKLSH